MRWLYQARSAECKQCFDSSQYGPEILSQAVGTVRSHHLSPRARWHLNRRQISPEIHHVKFSIQESSSPWVGKVPWRRNGNPLQNSGLENSMDRGSLAGYSPWSSTESDTPERLNRKYLQHLFSLLCVHSHNLSYITATCAPQSQKRPAKDAL